MRKKLTVKHTHRYTLESAILYDGHAQCKDCEGAIQYTYEEADGVLVLMKVCKDWMEIQRMGEVHSTLTFKKNEATMNAMKSEFGVFDIEIYTYDYECSDSYIVVEYDIENGSEDKDGYKIEIEVKEDMHEYH